MTLAIVTTARASLAADPSADDLKRARELFAQAEKDEESGSWGPALEKLRRAIQVKETAGLRFHVATCEDNLGQLRAAEEDYLAAQKRADQEHNKEVLAAVTDPLAALRARIPTVRIVVPSDVSDAVVHLDDRTLSQSELAASIALDPGEHRVTASAEGRRPFDQALHVRERDTTTITLSLPREAAASAPGTPAATREAPPARHGKSRTGAWLATGGAVLLAAGGVGAFLLAGSAQATGRDDCAAGASGCSGDKTRVRAWDATALGAWIGAAGLGAFATYLWLSPSDDTATSRGARLRVGPAHAAVEGRF